MEKGCWNSVVIKSGIEREEVMAESRVIEGEMKKGTVAGNKTSAGLQRQWLKGKSLEVKQLKHWG